MEGGGVAMVERGSTLHCRKAMEYGKMVEREKRTRERKKKEERKRVLGKKGFFC